jgi:hypothetical protein
MITSAREIPWAIAWAWALSPEPDCDREMIVTISCDLDRCMNNREEIVTSDIFLERAAIDLRVTLSCEEADLSSMQFFGDR